MSRKHRKPQNRTAHPSSNSTTSTRAQQQRLASKLAAEAQAAAVTAKERQQQTIIGAIVTLVVVALVAVIGVTAWGEHSKAQQIKAQTTSGAYRQLQAVAQKPANTTDQAGLLACKKAKLNAKVPTVEIYLDFMCPTCGELNRKLDATLEKMNKARQINIEVHPVTFLDGNSTDHYSLRTASAAAYIASKDPDHLMDFVSSLFEKDFQPSETAYKPVSDDQIICQAVKAGVDKTTATKATQGTYTEYMSKANNYTVLHRPELCDTAMYPQGGTFATPLIRINKSVWSLKDRSYDELASDFENGIGLKAQDVGNAKVLPTLGPDNAPKSA
ncbi:thioredoxin domain-containing protein [Bifidobacterium sp. ESL0682]|uniref:DsbA family protein n=1 Tax=Bifidobacterium sp. ESL0682 TaxID=2983212 RepID=UPI0023F80C2A|nr:thioredoxin domain-containing protein [Bifidobacterium sp. ESL0682]WEV41504.1 thioredoxin domain-containing protein [Bifidobacterium sp. ESL0682]